LRLITIYKVGKRTHRKILVVDGKIAYTGGLGIDDRWLGDARNPKEWRDTQVRVAGPVVDQMQAIFAEDWTYVTGEILVGQAFYPKRGTDRRRRRSAGDQGLARRRVLAREDALLHGDSVLGQDARHPERVLPSGQGRSATHSWRRPPAASRSA
jgi:phosphatidylserine/phosphatidylglycerophosphate/cardiolipin synthase-like enzyme